MARRELSRSQERSEFTDRIRIVLLEGDMDRIEDMFDRFTKDLADLKKLLFGILVSVTIVAMTLLGQGFLPTRS